MFLVGLLSVDFSLGSSQLGEVGPFSPECRLPWHVHRDQCATTKEEEGEEEEQGRSSGSGGGIIARCEPRVWPHRRAPAATIEAAAAAAALSGDRGSR
ncbi:unnamed protein product, partial [Lampetra fluviatilis]